MADQQQPFGKLEVPVEFSTKSLKPSAKAVSRAVREEGRAIGKEMVDALERQFQLDQARIKDGVARGFLSPAEAQKAGQEAAAAYNKGVISVIDQLSASGAFRGKAGKEAFTEIAGSLKTVEDAAGRTGLGLGRLNNSLVTVVQQAAGASPVMGRLFDTVGTFAIGTAEMIPILAGLAALAYGISEITEKATAEREALDKATDALKAHAFEAGKAPGADINATRNQLEKRIADLNADIKALEAAQNGPNAAVTGVEQFSPEDRAAKLRRELAERKVALIEAEAELRQIERDEQAKRDKQIREGIEVGNRLEKQGQEERARIAKEGAEKRARVAETESQLRAQLARLTASGEDDLVAAIDKLEEQGKKAAADAGVQVSQAFIDGIAKLRENAKVMQALEPFRAQLHEFTRLDPGQDQQKGLEALIEGLKRARDQLDPATAAWAAYNAVLEQAEDLHKRDAKAIEAEAKAEDKRDAADAARKRREELQDLRERARSLEENARAAIQVAESIGLIGDKAGEALQSLAQLGAAIVRIAGDDPSAIPSAIGAAASLIKTLMPDVEKERQERLKQLEATVALEKALKDLQHAVLSDISEREKERILGIANGIPIDKFGLGAVSKGKPVSDLTPQELAAIQEIEKATGIKIIVDDRIDPRAFSQALEAFKNLNIGTFPDTIQGKIDAEHFRQSIVGGTADEAFQRFLSDIRSAQGGLAKGFSDALGQAFKDGGPKGAKAFVDDIVKRLAAGDQTLFTDKNSPFFGLDAEELRQLLEESNTLLDNIANGTGAGGTTNDFIQARSITEVTASRLLGLDTTRNVLLTQIRDLIAGQLGVDASALSAGLNDFSASAHAGLGLTSVSGVPVSISIGTLIDGGINVNAEHGIIDAAQFQAQVSEMVVRGLNGAVAVIEQRLADNHLAKLRSKGRG